MVYEYNVAKPAQLNLTGNAGQVGSDGADDVGVPKYMETLFSRWLRNFGPFDVTIQDSHPITRGVPAFTTMD